MHSATVSGTGTPVGTSALITVYSRAMSCAVGSTCASGGRRSAQVFVPSVMR